MLFVHVKSRGSECQTSSEKIDCMGDANLLEFDDCNDCRTYAVSLSGRLELADWRPSITLFQYVAYGLRICSLPTGEGGGTTDLDFPWSGPCVIVKIRHLARVLLCGFAEFASLISKQRIG
jgi:hypothetical protein